MSGVVEDEDEDEYEYEQEDEYEDEQECLLKEESREMKESNRLRGRLS